MLNDPWLLNLKVGDPVFVTSWRSNLKHKVTVDRVTKTMIITSGGGRYSRKTGEPVGSIDYNPSVLTEWSSEEQHKVNQVRRKIKMVNTLRNTAWSKLPDEKLEKILNLISE